MDSSSGAARLPLDSFTLLLGGQPLAWGAEVTLPAATPLALALRCGPDVPQGGAAAGLRLEPDSEPQAGQRESHAPWLAVPLEAGGVGLRSAPPWWQQEFAGQRQPGDLLVLLTWRGGSVEGAEVLVHFQLDPVDQQRYDYMRAVLSGQDERVLRDPNSVIAGLNSDSLATPRTRLEARWAAIRKAHEGLTGALQPILSSPQTRLSHAVETLEWSAQIGSRALAGAGPAPGTPWMPAPPGSRLALSRLPQRLIRPFVEIRHDVPANRYVRHTIDLLISEAREVEREAATRAAEITTRLEGTVHRWRRERLEAARNGYRQIGQGAGRLRRHSVGDWLGRSFLGSVRPAPPQATDLVWRDNTYYRRVRYIRRLLEAELRTTEDALLNSDVATPTISINVMYELWAAMLLLETLCTAFGCRLLRKGGYVVAPTSTPNYLLNRGSSAELRAPSGKRLVLRFDLEYPSWRDPHSPPPAYGVDRRTQSQAKGRPDLALEVWDDETRTRVPQIITCDVTWSARLDTQVTKFLYRESIRDFTKVGRSGQPARPVLGSWVIYPGPADDIDYEDDYRTGRLPLDPSAEAANTLVATLDPLLRLAGAL